MNAEIQLFESADQTPLDFSLWGWMKSGVHKRKVDTRDELLARILDAAACTKRGEYQLRRTTRHLRTRFVKCAEVDVGIFESIITTIIIIIIIIITAILGTAYILR